jgi:trimeric autotransporter adhesin
MNFVSSAASAGRRFYCQLLAYLCLFLVLALTLQAAAQGGKVTFGGLPLPGALVTASQGGKQVSAFTDVDGAYTLPDITDGKWTIKVEMQCFETLQREVTVATDAPAEQWELKVDSSALQNLPQVTSSAAAPSSPQAAATPAPAQTKAAAKKGKNAPQAANTGSGFQRPDVNATATAAADAGAPPDMNTGMAEAAPSEGYLINGSVNNGGNSPFAQSAAFGNSRYRRSLYNAMLSMNLSQSALDARPFSLTGLATPKPDYARAQGALTVGGPLKIPHLIKNGPNMTLAYQWARVSDASTVSARVPTLAERAGDFSLTRDALNRPVTIIDPATGVPFPGAAIPATRLSAQAISLLALYPRPNAAGTAYNYQRSLLSATHQDGFTASGNKSIRSKNSINGQFSYQNSRGDTSSLLGLTDRTRGSGVNGMLTFMRRVTARQTATVRYQIMRQSTRLVPFFANIRNISGEAGVTGNNQEPANWGPPTLAFTNGIATLTDSQSSLTRNQTSTVTGTYLWVRGAHSANFGAEYGRQQINQLSQQDARGTFTFTGQAAGYDFAGFLLGIPDASSIAFGNADKYLRTSSYSAYVTDDWRIKTSVTLVLGLRWDYNAPITELRGRLVNLDIAPGYSQVAPVTAANPVGGLTGRRYADSLLAPDKGGVQPRIGFSWRPMPASSLIIRGGYGVYRDNNVYQSIATRMAQQSPLSRSLSVQNSAANPLTLASGFNAAPNITTNTFAVDPNFHIGYSQNWQLSMQKDLPASLVTIITYAGVKGTRLQQQFLPNTYPAGAVNPCPSCPSGYAYLTSNGNSTRNSIQTQLRRRLRRGLTAEASYTYSKSIDNGSPGTQPTFTAQNWLAPGADRGLSNFDQRHLFNLQGQYTTGMGSTVMGGGWRRLFTGWTITAQLTAGSGTPQTPVYPAVVAGTGVQGTVRPDYTGAALYDAPPGLHLNPAAITAPAAGHWGNAGRNSIIGPTQFSTNAGLMRTFQFTDRITTDLRMEASNPINHVTYSRWNTVANAQFGVPEAANAMRSMRLIMRVRF